MDNSNDNSCIILEIMQVICKMRLDIEMLSEFEKNNEKIMKIVTRLWNPIILDLKYKLNSKLF